MPCKSQLLAIIPPDTAVRLLFLVIVISSVLVIQLTTFRADLFVGESAKASNAPNVHSTTVGTTTIGKTTTEEPPEPFEVFVMSAYYYPTSQSLGNNSLAFVFISDFFWRENVGNYTTIRAFNGNTSKTSKCKLEIMNPWHDRLCKLVATFSTCDGIEMMDRLEMDLGNDTFQQIPFETIANKEKREVVTCISPLWAAERWQLLIFAAHTYRRFGTFMHLYARSIVQPLYELAKLYEKEVVKHVDNNLEGYLKLQPWLRVKYTSIPDYVFNPNQHMAFRSQEGAETDCLLQYKESAEFVTFMDLDDILIPRLATTYLDEFRQLMPGYDFIHYHKENTYYEASMVPSNFTTEHIFKTLDFQHVDETGKYATRPRLVNYTTIHFPTLLNNPQPRGNGRGHMINRDRNVIVHLKKMSLLNTFAQNTTIRTYEFNNKGTAIFSENDATAIELDYQRLYSKYTVTFLNLPTTTAYVQLFEKCYHSKYYRHWNYNHPERITYCPNPDMCKISSKLRVPCSNGDADYFSTENGSVINVHFARNRRFTLDDRCIS